MKPHRVYAGIGRLTRVGLVLGAAFIYATAAVSFFLPAVLPAILGIAVTGGLCGDCRPSGGQATAALLAFAGFVVLVAAGLFWALRGRSP